MWSPSPEEWGRIEPLIDQLLTLPPSERSGFIEQHLSTGDELRQFVERLVAGSDDPIWLAELSPNLVSEALGGASPPPLVETGSTVGPFRIVREIGRGGSGRVYEAERAFGSFTQRLALKVVPRALESESLRRRFLVEQKLLARLEHPNVARLVDAGVRSDGLPWLAMEYVDGVRIDEWCDGARLDLSGRLELFLSVCDAVQAAHQRLVVHRDLKPSNIFVSRDGTVRLLDFGVATLLEADPSGSDELTRPEERMFTPEYAAPEQWRQEPATTATDCFALGVLFYQLVTGRRPWPLESHPRGEWGRILSEEEPRAPSAAVSDDAASTRGTTAPRLIRALRGDLDAIALKALRADPERRYATARELADDIRRHLEGTPVLAREGRWSYRAGRFFRRNRVAVSAAAAVLLALVSGVAAASWQARRANRAAAESIAVTRFLTRLFEQGSPGEARGEQLTASDMLQRASRGVDSMFPDQPGHRIQVLLTVAGINRELGRLDHADTIARRALAVVDSFRLGGLNEVLAIGMVGSIASARDQLPEADSLTRQALALASKAGAPDSVRARLHHTQASVLFRMERFAEAEAADRDALRLGRDLGLGWRAFILGHLAMEVTSQTQERAHDAKRLADSDSLYRLALATYREAGMAGHPDYLSTLSSQGTAWLDRSRPDSARRMLAEALAGLERIYAPDHEQVLSAVNNLAQADLELEHAAAAEAGFARSRAGALATHGPDHFLSVIPWFNMGKAQLAGGKPEKAEATLRGVLRQLKTRDGIDGRLALAAWMALGRALSQQQRFAEILPVLDSAATLTEAMGPNSALPSEIAIDRASALIGLRRPEEAEVLARDALTWRRANLEPRGKAMADATFTLARALMARGDDSGRDEAVRLAEEALAILREVPWPTAMRATVDSTVTHWRGRR